MHFFKTWSFIRRITALAFFPNPPVESSFIQTMLSGKLPLRTTGWNDTARSIARVLARSLETDAAGWEPPPTGIAGQFLGAIVVSRLYIVLFLLQIVPALLLLANRYVPLALTILGAIVLTFSVSTFSWRLPVCLWLCSSRSYGFLRLGVSDPLLRRSFNVK